MVILLGFRFPSLNANYESMYERVAEDEQCLLIEDLLDGILSNPSLKSDEIHPNARGYALMAERVAGPTEKLLRVADAMDNCRALANATQKGDVDVDTAGSDDSEFRFVGVANPEYVGRGVDRAQRAAAAETRDALS